MMFSNIFKKKEKDKMSTTTNAQLSRGLVEQRDRVNQLNSRLSTLVDEIHLLRTELNSFKESVAHDVKYLTDRVDND